MKTLIIGGGIAGLSAGAFLQMNGFETQIFELNTSPGGLCTAWQNQGYQVDFCVHWLMGSGPATSIHDRWNELINLSDMDIVNYEVYARVENENGDYIDLYTNIDQLENELLTKAPEDEKEIRKFVKTLRKLSNFDSDTELAMQVAPLGYKLKQMFKMLPFIPLMGKYMKLTCAEYAMRFSNPLLRKAIHNLFEPGMSVVFAMMMLAFMHNKAAGYPIGGSRALSESIADRYLRLGGKIHYGSKVTRILVEKNRTVGIQLENGAIHKGDFVVSAADGYSTLFEMLEGQYVDPPFARFYENQKTFPSLVFVALGINRDLSEWPSNLLFPLKEPVFIDPQTTVAALYARIHHFDPTLAPEGKTLVSTMLQTYAYDYWVDLYGADREKYDHEKQRIAQAFIQALEDRFGNIAGSVEMIDVSTPVTIISYTNNWKGSFEGWQITPETGWGQLPYQLKSLSNFYMCGHWVAVGGGLPPAMMSGRTVAQMICKKVGRPFQTIPPVSEKEGMTI